MERDRETREIREKRERERKIPCFLPHVLPHTFSFSCNTRALFCLSLTPAAPAALSFFLLQVLGSRDLRGDTRGAPCAATLTLFLTLTLIGPFLTHISVLYHSVRAVPCALLGAHIIGCWLLGAHAYWCFQFRCYNQFTSLDLGLMHVCRPLGSSCTRLHWRGRPTSSPLPSC